MPLGIPKVAYQFRLDDEPIWIDIYAWLFEERTLFLCEEITISFANRFTALLLHLNSETDIYDDTDDDISIYMNSTSGGIHPSLTIYDTMKIILPDVCTLAIGATGSVASLILAAGTITKRVALPHARISIILPRSAVADKRINIDSLRIIEENTFELYKTFANIYAENIDQPVDVIQKDMVREFVCFMSATEAQDYGIIDRIAKFKKENE